jgi:hypothetical protein
MEEFRDVIWITGPRLKPRSCGNLGLWSAAEDIAVRFEGEKMFLKRPNGSELETTIVHKIG